MKLIFTSYSISKNKKPSKWVTMKLIGRDDEWKSGIFSLKDETHITEYSFIDRYKNGFFAATEKRLVFGSNIFDTPFCQNVLGDSIFQEMGMDELNFLDSLYTIPKAKILYPGIGNRKVRSTDRGMQEHSGSYIQNATFTEKFKYFQTNKNDLACTWVYECANDTECALAELDYYIRHGYKINYCKICGKPFFTDSLKNKYCSRVGESPSYPECACYDVPARERDKKYYERPSIKQKKIITERLKNNSCGAKSNDILYDFLNECDSQKNILSKNEYDEWMNVQYQKYVPGGKQKALRSE